MTEATKSLGSAPLFPLVAVLTWPLVALAFRPRVLGRRHVPRRGGFVACPNHVSGWDVMAVSYPLAPRRVRQMGKNQLFRRPLLGPVVRTLGAFPAHDGPDGLGGVEAAAALARAGQVVAIFPEGARRRRDRVHQPRTGAALVALTAGVPLLPVALRGTDRWRRLGRWWIAFGPPVAVDDLRGKEPLEVAHEATERLWAAIVDLEAELA